MKYLRRYNEHKDDKYNIISANTRKEHLKIKEVFELNLEGILNDVFSVESIRVHSIRGNPRRFKINIEENFTENPNIVKIITDFKAVDACTTVCAINENILNKIARKYVFIIVDSCILTLTVDSWPLDELYDVAETFENGQIYFNVEFTIIIEKGINTILESLFSTSDDETFIKDAINAIKSGEIYVKETGGGRAPMARRSHLLYHFDFGDKHISVEQPMEGGNIFDSKISVCMSEAGKREVGDKLDIGATIKRRLLNAIQNKFDEYGNRKLNYRSTKHE